MLCYAQNNEDIFGKTHFTNLEIGHLINYFHCDNNLRNNVTLSYKSGNEKLSIQFRIQIYCVQQWSHYLQVVSATATLN